MRSHISPGPQSPTIGLYQCYDQYILGLAKHVDIPWYTPGTLLISTLLGEAPSCDISIPTFSLAQYMPLSHSGKLMPIQLESGKLL